jgi:hypothetical protein
MQHFIDQTLAIQSKTGKKNYDKRIFHVIKQNYKCIAKIRQQEQQLFPKKELLIRNLPFG